MSLFTLPIEIIEDFVLIKLPWNDLLRLRRVCKHSKMLVHSYIRERPHLGPEIEIDFKRFSDGNLTLCDMVEAGHWLTTERLYFRNLREYVINYCIPDLLHRYYLCNIVEAFGFKVKHLRVDRLSVNCDSIENTFYSGFMKVETFHAENLVIQNNSTEITLPPVCCEQLKRLHLGELHETDDKYLFSDYLTLTLASCTNLDWLHIDPGYCFEKVMGVLTGVFPTAPTLKTVHFGSADVVDKQMVTLFLETCVNNGVTIFGVDSDWMDLPSVLAGRQLGVPIGSMEKLRNDTDSLRLDMPNLEHFSVRSVGMFAREVTHRVEQHLLASPRWLRMKKLELKMDDTSTTQTSLLDVCWFLFNEIKVFETLEELHLDCNEWGNVDEVGKQAAFIMKHLKQPECPPPRITKLTLTGFKSGSEVLATLWERLAPTLEELVIDNCSGLTNAAFIGDDPENPTFLKLTKLKKLTFKRFDWMKKITDVFFESVLRHMSLEYFTIEAKRPVRSVTTYGFIKLLSGPFLNSIKYFPFTGWSLNGIVDKHFQGIGRCFKQASV